MQPVSTSEETSSKKSINVEDRPEETESLIPVKETHSKEVEIEKNKNKKIKGVPSEDYSKESEERDMLIPLNDAPTKAADNDEYVLASSSHDDLDEDEDEASFSTATSKAENSVASVESPTPPSNVFSCMNKFDNNVSSQQNIFPNVDDDDGKLQNILNAATSLTHKQHDDDDDDDLSFCSDMGVKKSFRPAKVASRGSKTKNTLDIFDVPLTPNRSPAGSSLRKKIPLMSSMRNKRGSFMSQGLRSKAMAFHAGGRYEDALQCFQLAVSESSSSKILSDDDDVDDGHYESWWGSKSPLTSPGRSDGSNIQMMDSPAKHEVRRVARDVLDEACRLLDDQEERFKGSPPSRRHLESPLSQQKKKKVSPRKKLPSLTTIASTVKTCSNGEDERERAMEAYIKTLIENGSNVGLARTLTKMGDYFISANPKEQGRNLAVAMKCYEKSFDLYEAQPYLKSLDCANMLDKMSIISNMRGKTDDAVKYASEGLCLYETEYGKKHEKVAACLHNIGCYLALAQKHEEAVVAYERALAMREDLLGENHEDIATTLFNLSFTFNRMGKHDQAIRCLEAVLRIRKSHRKSLLGFSHDKVALTLHRMGDVYRDMGNVKEARRHYELVLEASKNDLDTCSSMMSEALHSLGILEHRMGDDGKAISHLKEALKIRKAHLGEYHEDNALTLCSLAAIHSDQGDNRRAVHCLRDALHIRKLTLGPDHELVGDTHNNLAFHFCNVSRFQEAKEHLVEALRIRRSGTSNQKVANALGNLGEVCRQMSDGAAAAEFFMEEIKVRRLDDSPDADEDEAPFIADAYLKAGDCYALEDDLRSAMDSYDEALRIRAECCEEGKLDISVAEVHSRMVLLHLRQEEQNMALVRFDEILRIKKSVYGSENHSDVAQTMTQMAFTHGSTGDWKSALERFEDACTIFEATGDKEQADHIRDFIPQIQSMNGKKVPAVLADSAVRFFPQECKVEF